MAFVGGVESKFNRFFFFPVVFDESREIIVCKCVTLLGDPFSDPLAKKSRFFMGLLFCFFLFLPVPIGILGYQLLQYPAQAM